MKRIHSFFQEKPAMRSVVIAAAVIIIYTIYTILSGKGSVGVNWSQNGVSISAPGGIHKDISYTQIRKASLEEDFDEKKFGAAAEGQGGADRSWRYGTWENEAWGTYSLFAFRKSEAVIVLTLQDDSIVVLSQESAKVTRSVYENLQEILSAEKET